MFIKRINLKNYKRFYDLTIDLGDNPKRIIALVGPNGCGKSSIFDAMIFLSNAYIGRIGEARSQKDYHYHSLLQDPSYDFHNVKIEFDGGNFQQVIENKRKAGEEKGIFSFRSSFRFNSALTIKQTNAVNNILDNNYGASSASDIDQRIEQNYRRLLAKYNRYRDDNDVRPSEARAQIIGDLNAAIKSCLDLTIVDIGNVEDDKGTLYFKKEDADIVFDYNVLSAGEKEVIDLLLDLYLRKDAYKDSIYIIDEPELHLNSSIQRLLLIEINKMVPENCQIWIATHSIGFLRALQEELNKDSQIIEFKQGNKWASEAYTLYPIKFSHRDWQSLFSTALDDLAFLICPRTIVFCEGKAMPGHGCEERGLDATIYNTIFSHKYPEVLFVSSGGNTELDQRSDITFSILSKVFQDLNVWVLKDRDMASGKDTDEETRLLYLSTNPHNHRVLKRYEIENYLFDKEVLVKYCLDHQLSFDDDKYDRIMKDIVNDNLKDQTGAIKTCCGIKTSINPEVFKKNLASYITEDMSVYKELEEVIFKRK